MEVTVRERAGRAATRWKSTSALAVVQHVAQLGRSRVGEVALRLDDFEVRRHARPRTCSAPLRGASRPARAPPSAACTASSELRTFSAALVTSVAMMQLRLLDLRLRLRRAGARARATFASWRALCRSARRSSAGRSMSARRSRRGFGARRNSHRGCVPMISPPMPPRSDRCDLRPAAALQAVVRDQVELRHRLVAQVLHREVDVAVSRLFLATADVGAVRERCANGASRSIGSARRRRPVGRVNRGTPQLVVGSADDQTLQRELVGTDAWPAAVTTACRRVASSACACTTSIGAMVPISTRDWLSATSLRRQFERLAAPPRPLRWRRPDPNTRSAPALR